MKEIVYTAGYIVVMITCMVLIDSKYGNLPTGSWGVLFVIAAILGRVGKRLEPWLINTYLFFGVAVLVLLLLFEKLYKLLHYLS
ncbi:MAG: hypothetical protein KF803_05750 [Cyclobacteriaceae bacterium]|nr:hypothetical protein [Cyclobacteriaceae bacterium]